MPNESKEFKVVEKQISMNKGKTKRPVYRTQNPNFRQQTQTPQVKESISQ